MVASDRTARLGDFLREIYGRHAADTATLRNRGMARLAAEGRHEISHLTGPPFKQRVEAIVEAPSPPCELNKERKAIIKQRAKQHLKVRDAYSWL